VKICLKIALNAVRLPKFEPVNGKSLSPRTMVLKDLRQRWTLTWFCACAERCVIFSTGPYTVLANNSICLNRSAIKVAQWRGKPGSGISNMGAVRTHNSRTDSRRIFKLGWGVDHVTCHVWPLIKVKRSKIKVTRSRNVSAEIAL